jgi:hypothetical protein
LPEVVPPPETNEKSVRRKSNLQSWVINVLDNHRHDSVAYLAATYEAVDLLGFRIQTASLVLQRKVRHGIFLQQLVSWKETEDHAHRDCRRNVPSA